MWVLHVTGLFIRGVVLAYNPCHVYFSPMFASREYYDPR
jgi:hypothetical protein